MSAFGNENPEVLFFSRGRGRGHAIPDMAILERLRQRIGDISCRFVSYGTGYSTLVDNGFDAVNLRMPDDNPLLETIVRATRVIGHVRPRLVISHEEFAVPPAARVFGIPSLFITEWFDRPESLLMHTLSYADETIFIEEPGIFPEPPYLKDKVSYVGPALRRFSYTRVDRIAARLELGLAPDSTVLLILPGSWTEEMAPIADLVESAVDGLDRRHRQIVWIAGKDFETLSRRFENRPWILVKKEDWQMDRLMAASDLALTKANRGTVRELSALGIPAISLSYGLNPMDDILVSHIPGNTALKVQEIDPAKLRNAMAAALQAAPGAGAGPLPPDGTEGAAERLALYIERLRQSSQVSSAAA